jgi:hypothetical protein
MNKRETQAKPAPPALLFQGLRQYLEEGRAFASLACGSVVLFFFCQSGFAQWGET